MEKKKWPVYGWTGLALIAVFWILNWSLSGNRTHWGFFPLWLGYSLAVDALVKVRKGTSLLSRSRKAYVGLFLISVLAWWLFELLNDRTHNWIYLGRGEFSMPEYFLFSTLSFSTVIPAVFGTAELVGTFSWIRSAEHGPKIFLTRIVHVVFFAGGWMMLLILLLWPRYFYPFVWLSVFFILDPLNAWLGNRSLLSATARGDWRPLIALGLGCMICGFFWEFWNFRSFPKWTYSVPIFGFGHIFEMPVLGYFGYIPFSWELFALYHLATGFSKKKNLPPYVQIIDEGQEI